eukprot:TRINITY_DN4248_c0_g1_i15.p1 TRINITY_DN4248_c0_g1~~TRINITY_DN4248_c0_g1_i15.p1  ORF type:complete len:181 (-),score=25.83 TRINITY_DN4248_c0_g1_i15:162-704(-)
MDAIASFSLFFFFNDTATTEIYTRSIVGSVRCVQETGYQRRVHGNMNFAFKNGSRRVFQFMKQGMRNGSSALPLPKMMRGRLQARTCLNLARMLSSNSTLLMRNNIFALTIGGLAELDELSELDQEEMQDFYNPSLSVETTQACALIGLKFSQTSMQLYRMDIAGEQSLDQLLNLSLIHI